MLLSWNDNKKGRREGHRGCKEVRFCCVRLYLIAGIDLEDKIPDGPAYKTRGFVQHGSLFV